MKQSHCSYNPNFKLWEEHLKRITGGDLKKVIAEMKKTMLRVFGEGLLRWLRDAAVESPPPPLLRHRVGKGNSMKEIAAKLQAAQVSSEYDTSTFC